MLRLGSSLDRIPGFGSVDPNHESDPIDPNILDSSLLLDRICSFVAQPGRARPARFPSRAAAHSIPAKGQAAPRPATLGPIGARVRGAGHASKTGKKSIFLVIFEFVFPFFLIW